MTILADHSPATRPTLAELAPQPDWSPSVLDSTQLLFAFLGVVVVIMALLVVARQRV